MNCTTIISNPLYREFYLFFARLKRLKSQLAISELNNLDKLIESYDSIFKIVLDKKIFYSKNEYTKFVKDVNNFFFQIFDYKSFCQNQNKLGNEEWNRHRLISLMEFSVCPYCNRAYITNYMEKDRRRKTTADLDHFYPKSKYPFLTLSLYNFIPSCQICNSRFKGDRFDAKNHIYPFNEEFGENANFNIDSETIDYILTNNKDFDIKIKIKDSNYLKSKITSSIQTFKLEEVYQVHKDYVQEILIKAKTFNSDRIEDLKQSFPDLYSDERKLQGILMNTDFIDLSKRPLSKLTKDICTQYGIENDLIWILNENIEP